MAIEARTWGIARSRARRGRCSAPICASRRTQSMAVAASNGPWRRRSARNAFSSSPLMTCHKGDSGSTADTTSSAAAHAPTRASGPCADIPVAQAAPIPAAPPAPTRAVACGTRRACPRRDSSWARRGRTTQASACPAPSSPSPSGGAHGAGAAPVPAPTSSSAAAAVLTGLLPAHEARAGAARAAAIPGTHTASATARQSRSGAPPFHAGSRRAATTPSTPRRARLRSATRTRVGAVRPVPPVAWDSRLLVLVA